ncbi:TetR/AcrR family transcriptional regulator [Ponticoccus sp. SC2-23]|uniref:TetR/AcrR family transcriptional regulator n=1 Tax=Alexandriicola marinus TaxID=2081710 RepID=UPI000FDC6F80|nr:TetR/AcrR family transcriptional regulator [Alexandriicola marinus]MBM1218745.1 TetR/AcrR family transcriptional regulator [Ponticoccus sp. SC6-9]MBM1224183.1 TetR/AcrR family transcriptional regulator [Ponticoccus sp. SC6-15]MBM1230038.1 TetR/AcrR family transcriptional regulator [Ponticoccus sp. SC6-38]MBM1233149.1 TetR/AcrR family transcriptional regulator [Ponticoccus sp. SC6-45]MBM1236901.1 TetR/AcrR family transcriptional regulator [Ponticoccus sp. SC6-49]MBM1242160.1 TetR/AcrR famil
MAGLRERQKADRERRILGAAVTKFRAEGYRSVRIEDLAEMAEVSVGTVYNYYQTKGDILIATVAMEVEEVLASGAEIVRAPPPGAEEALLSLIFSYYDHSLEYLSKEMWRTAMALAIEAPGTPNGRRYAELDARLSAQVTDLIRALQARGEVRADVDPVAMGQLIFNNLNQMFIEFVKEDDMTLETLRSEVAAQTAPLARLIAPEAQA